MNPEDQKRLDTLLDLFIHPGWQLFMDEMREAHGVLVETAWTLKDERQLYQRKGEIQKLGELLSYESLMKMQASENETI